MKRLQVDPELPKFGARVLERATDTVVYVVAHHYTSKSTRIGMAYKPGGTEAITCSAEDFDAFWKVLP